MKLILFALLLLTLNLNAQDTNPECDYKIEKVSEGKYKTKVIGFDSLSRMESCFLGWMNTGKGKPNGELLVYDENGKRRRLAIYKGGIRAGKHLEWYATGELYSEINWETDLYFTTKAYYKSGKISHTAVNGNRDNAVYTDYYENGKVKSVTNYAEHFEKNYFETGLIKSEKIDSKRTYKEWHPNGKVKVTGSLGVGAFGRIGKWLFYDDKGKLVRELIYEENNSGWYGTDEGYSKEIKH
jgi:antitoxin component YwqK of YwqJK toxin-antitoxin module